MKAIKSGPGSFIIEFSQAELGVINNALNEVCSGIDIPEFQTRMGSSIDEVRELLSKISDEYVNSSGWRNRQNN